MKRTTLFIASLGFVPFLTAVGCGEERGSADESTTVDVPSEGKPDGWTAADEDRQSVCVAVRGNGPRITAHFSSLARIMEHYGPIAGIAGGSSASMTAFLTESIQANPAVYECDNQRCSTTSAGARAALLFKSLFGYVELLGTETAEASAYASLRLAAEKIRELNLENLAATDAAQARQDLETLLESPELRDLVNPEFVELLRISEDLLLVPDLIKGVLDAANWRVDDPKMLLRPGLVNFDAFAERVGRMGTFYAGDEPADREGITAWLDECAGESRGQTWNETRELATSDGSTCGETFLNLVRNFRSQFLAGAQDFPSRIDRSVGHAGTTVLVVSALFTGDTAESFKLARESYLSRQPVDFEPDFDDVMIGYWGRNDVLERLTEGLRQYEDLSSQKAHAFGETTWLDAIVRSAGEPGLARGLELPGHGVTIAGWPDALPVQALSSAGCDVIIALTRRGDARSFVHGVLRLAGGDAQDDEAFFSLDAPQSSLYGSLNQAHGVWCTDWDAPDQTDLAAMFAVGYDAPMESAFPLLVDGEGAYANTSESLGLPGCTPKVVDEPVAGP